MLRVMKRIGLVGLLVGCTEHGQTPPPGTCFADETLVGHHVLRAR